MKNKLLIGSLAMAVIAVVVITVLFTRASVKNKALKQEQAIFQKLIDAKNETIRIYSVLHDEAIASAREHEINDSIARQQVVANKKTYIPIEKGYAEIPKNIDAIRNDKLAIHKSLSDY